MVNRRLLGVNVAIAVFLLCTLAWNELRHRSQPVATPPTPRVDSVPVSPGAAEPVPPEKTRVSAPSSAESPVRGSGPDPWTLAYILRTIRASAESTYLNEIVEQSGDSALHRWDDRMSAPVRVYVPSTSTAADFQPEFVDAVGRAFQEWADAGVPVRFDVSPDSKNAEVRFEWAPPLEQGQSDQTHTDWNGNGEILSGIVMLSTVGGDGRAYTARDVQALALHEIGHLIGLGHSDDKRDIMYPQSQVPGLSARDIRTALLLYRLPPGSLRSAVSP